MVLIKKYSSEYREWKAYQNKKNLKIRTKKRAAKRAYRTSVIQHYIELKHEPDYNADKRRFEFAAPYEFSFIRNPKGTIGFFEDIISFIKKKHYLEKNIFIDISNVVYLTSDALMYLLAIVNNLNAKLHKGCRISGNSPENLAIRRMFAESGFYQFVRSQKIPLIRNTDRIQIVSGERTEPSVAKQLVDFVCSKAAVQRKETQFLYDMIIELMSNAHKHAYNEEEDVLYPRWYCFADYISSEDAITFAFMDTGAGIPATVRKNFMEKIDILKIRGDSKYIISALKGDFRSETNHQYRGKGLPRIYSYYRQKKIEDLRIIANCADVSACESSFNEMPLSSPLRGTLFHWKINLARMRR